MNMAGQAASVTANNGGAGGGGTNRIETGDPQHGPIYGIRATVTVVVGIQQYYPNGEATIDDKNGCWIFRDDPDHQCVWMSSHKCAGYWARVPYSSCSYIRYCHADGRKPGQATA
jgi:hypothetical protein